MQAMLRREKNSCQGDRVSANQCFLSWGALSNLQLHGGYIFDCGITFELFLRFLGSSK